MPPRNAGKSRQHRQHRVDVPLSPLQKEFVCRKSWDMNHMSQAEFLRTGRIPHSTRALEAAVIDLRKKQHGDTEVMARS